MPTPTQIDRRVANLVVLLRNRPWGTEQRARARQLGCLLNGAPARAALATAHLERTRELGTDRQEAAYERQLARGCWVSVTRAGRVQKGVVGK